MIHKITCKKIDKSLLSKSKEDINIPRSYTDFKDVIVKKPWGYEYLVFQNESIAIWMLHIARRKKTSMHSHIKKRTSLVLLSGDTVCRHLEGEIALKPLDAVIIREGAFHSTEAFSTVSITPQSEDGIWVMEIESPPSKTDLVRIKDEYGRAKTSYEGVDHMVFGSRECLKLEAPKKMRSYVRLFLIVYLVLEKVDF